MIKKRLQIKMHRCIIECIYRMVFKMNLQEIITKLISDGFTEAGIAKQVSADQSTIQRIKKGSEPKYGLGCRIKALYMEHVGKPISE